MFCDCDSKTGHLKFYNRNGVDHSTFDAYSINNLWYHDVNVGKSLHTQNDKPPFLHPTINKINKAAKHELWHQRLIHPGDRCMKTIHKHVDGIDEPLVGN